jgi:aminoglycoside phosphotransferase family enzyme/predicted kinase
MNSRNRHRVLIQTLLDPDAYSWRPSTVELIETHMSWVLLAGDRVVKIERPVHFGFVDHTGIDQRRASSEAEVRLNRRLTEGVYLDVVPVTRRAGRLFIDGGGELFDWAVLMRRLPADRMLDQLLADGAAPGDLTELLARRLIPFHLSAAVACDPQTTGAAASVASIVTSNLDELRDIIDGSPGAVQFALASEAMRSFIANHGSRLQQRVTDGWIREGHGDLRAEHICIEAPEQIQIFDCVAFSEAIRCADVASDLAFLIMDLNRLGAGRMATELIHRYHAAGVELPDALMRLYQAHRALVRAKVAGLSRGGDQREGVNAASSFAEYLSYALRALYTYEPFLAVMTGLSGTGKSTVAASIAASTGALLISSDTVRKELAGVTGSASAIWGEGIYTPEWNERTYEALIAAGRKALYEGMSVVLDATFLEERWREAAAQLARAASAPLLLVETVGDESVIAARIADRTRAGESVSDAGVAIHDRQRESVSRNAPSVPRGAITVRVDTSLPNTNPFDLVVAAMQRAGVVKPALVD